MDRREFLSALSASLTVPAVACATTGAPGSAGQTERFLHDLAARDRAARSHASSPAVRRELRGRGLAEDHLAAGLGMLGTLKAVAEAPADVREDPRVRAIVQEQGTALGRHLIDSVDMLDRLTPDDLARAQAVLKADPDLFGRDAEAHMRAEFAAKGGTEEDAHRTVRLLRRVTWQLTHLDGEAAVGGVIDRFDRIARRQGLEEAPQDAGETAPGESGETTPAGSRYTPHPIPMIMLKIGLATAGVGALSFGAGLVLIATEVGVDVGVNLTVAGVVILYVAVIVLLLTAAAFGVDLLIHALK